MKRILPGLLTLFCLCASSVAVAQSFKSTKNGGFEVTTPDGKVMTVGKDGKVSNKDLAKVSGRPAKDSNELSLGGSTAKEPRTKGNAESCAANSDLLVEHKTIEGVPVAITMTGTCDADVFNTSIDADKGVSVAGTGELRLTESAVRAKEVAINVSGTGDVVLEGAQISGPIAINIAGTGNVIARNSKIFGKIVIAGTGKFIDEGGNELVADHTKAVLDNAEPAKKKKAKK